jgi:acid phosphatase
MSGGPGKTAIGLLVCAALIASVAATTSHLTFITVGDWGGVALGGYHESNAYDTATLMGELGAAWNISFVVNVGDNFYYYGVQSATDGQWQKDWTSTFTAPSIQVPWYSVLGNHDYAGVPEAQLNYPYNKNWVMPARSYTQRIHNPSANEYITFVYWDSNPCVSAWRADDPSGWDPSTPQFHNNIVAQDCTTLESWLKSTLSQITDRWIIFVTHVPPELVDMFDLVGMLDTYGVAVALVGHSHWLEYYTFADNNVDYIISGAGCMVVPEALEKKNENIRRLQQYTPTPIVQWKEVITGVTVHEFTASGDYLWSKFYDKDQTELYSFSSTPRNTAAARAKEAAKKGQAKGTH